MLQIILAIFAFGVLVIVHEFGHFITAKRGRVQVNEFWIGMGPTLLKKQHNGTLYSLKLLPFGGACVMEGEDSESDNDHAFGKASLPRRMLIVAAGALRGAGDTLAPSVMNLVSMWGVRITLAALLAPRFGLAGVWGAMCFELCVRGVLFLVRLLRGRWLEKAKV